MNVDGTQDARSTINEISLRDFSSSVNEMIWEDSVAKTDRMGKKRSCQDVKPDKQDAKKKAENPIEKGDFQSSSLKKINTDTSKQTELCYMKSDNGPFRAIINLNIEDKNNPPKPPVDMDVSRILIKMGINFTVIDRTGKYRWMATFPDRTAANNALKNPIIKKSKFSISIPWFLVYRKVVIKGVPKDISEEELYEEMKESNPSMVFDKEGIQRLKARIYQDNEVQYVDSTSVRLNIRSSTIPSHIFLWRTRTQVVPFIPSIRQCFNCGQLNHATKFCTNNAKCLLCGKEIHQDSPCNTPLQCINCNGNHKALAKDCPEVIIKKRTTTLMATENVDYNVARRIIGQEGRTSGYNLAAAKPGISRSTFINPSVFPRLPTSQPMSGSQDLLSKRTTTNAGKLNPSTNTPMKAQNKEKPPAWISNEECYNKWSKIMQFLNSHEDSPSLISQFFELVSKYSHKTSQNGQD